MDALPTLALGEKLRYSIKSLKNGHLPGDHLALRFGIKNAFLFSETKFRDDMHLNRGSLRKEMATEDQKREIAQKFLAALRTRDWRLLKSILAPEVVWSLPGTSVISGNAEGVDAVIKRSQLITSYGLNFALNHVLFGEYGLALSLNNTAQRGSLTLDEHLATVCSLREDRVDRIDTYLSDVAMVNAFFV